MVVRLSTSYSSLARTNPLRIGTTSVPTVRCLWIWNRNVDTSCRAAAQSRVGIAVATAVGPIVIVTENATELVRNVGTAVLARRVVDRRPRCDRHADHPAERPLRVRKCGKRGLYAVGRRRFEPRSERSSSLIRICLDPFLPHYGLLAPLVVVKCGRKWAGADSNCGYGHPKAEGYQATPPARTF